jgi:hypothetical protein
MNTTGLSHINRFEEFALFVASIFMLLSEGRLSKAEVYLSEYILRPPDNGWQMHAKGFFEGSAVRDYFHFAIMVAVRVGHWRPSPFLKRPCPK